MTIKTKKIQLTISMPLSCSFYHTKYKRIQAPHVVGHYAAGARVIGLTENQLRRHMESLKARHAAGDNKSPYAEPLHIVFGKAGIFC